MNKKIYVPIVIALIAVSFIIGASIKTITSKPDTTHVSALWETAVYTQVKHNGVWGPFVDNGHNLVTTAGLNWITDKIGPNNGTGNMNAIALGNGTEGDGNAADLTLPGQINGCGLDPAAGTVAKMSGQANFSVSKVWTAGSGCGAVIVNTTALYNQSSPGTSCGAGCVEIAGKNFTTLVTLQQADQLNVTWYVWATSG